MKLLEELWYGNIEPTDFDALLLRNTGSSHYFFIEHIDIFRFDEYNKDISIFPNVR